MRGEDDSRSVDRFGAFVAFTPDAPAGAGPLAGLRVAVKDNIAVAGLPFTAGHPLFSDRTADTDAPAVRQLRDAGARIVGVTYTDAGGFGVTTPVVKNPAAPGRTVGGSSGGSAAAVAAGLADVALGTDTGGSVRIPAACTGLVGFKPTCGRISIEGTWPLSPSLDHIGVIGRGLESVAHTADVLLGHDAEAEAPAISTRLRIGIDRAPMDHCDVAVEKAFKGVLAALAAKHEIVPLDWPDATQVLDAHRDLLLAEAGKIYASLTPAEFDRLAVVARRALALAGDVTPDMLLDARRIAAETASAVETLFGRADILLSPTITCPVPAQDARRVEIRGRSISVVHALIANTMLFNMSGHPAVAMPSAPTLNGLPFSVQIAARRNADRALLDAASALAPLLRG